MLSYIALQDVGSNGLEFGLTVAAIGVAVGFLLVFSLAGTPGLGFAWILQVRFRFIKL